MRVYLDTCSIQRPLDSRTQIRIVLEAEAILGIISLVEAGNVELVSSDALAFEIARNPNMVRREYALNVVSKARRFVKLNTKIERRASEFVAQSLRPLDALHLASAEEAKADYFCTCDDSFLKIIGSMDDLRIRTVSPVQLIEEFEKW